MDEKILEKMLKIAEEFFGTENDPEQMPITKESFYKLQEIHPKTVVYKLDKGEPVSWIVVLPTSKELMEKFLNKEINEKQLLEMTEPAEEYEAIYLCAAFTIPEYRRRGYIIEMFREAIGAIPHKEPAELFAWPFSKEGRSIIEKAESLYKIRIRTR